MHAHGDLNKIATRQGQLVIVTVHTGGYCSHAAAESTVRRAALSRHARYVVRRSNLNQYGDMCQRVTIPQISRGVALISDGGSCFDGLSDF
jgi:hypothetical protein